MERPNHRITHLGEAMSKSNHYQICVPKGGGKPFMYVPSDIKKYGEELSLVAKLVTDTAYKGPIKLDIIAYFGSCRRKDIQNTLKTLCDALNGVSYDDDSQIVEIHAFKRLDKENPRVEIHVTELPNHEDYPLTFCQPRSAKR